MIIYYDTDTGQVVRWCSSELEPDPTLGRIEADVSDPLAYRVAGGALVPDDARAWDDLRQARDRMLAASDWTQVADAPVDRAAWGAYRQALRDLPGQTTDPANPDWPEKPA